MSEDEDLKQAAQDVADDMAKQIKPPGWDDPVEAAPRPWNWVSVAAKASGGCHVYLVDANGRKIGVIWGKAGEKIATIQKICDMVNAGDA